MCSSDHLLLRAGFPHHQQKELSLTCLMWQGPHRHQLVLLTSKTIKRHTKIQARLVCAQNTMCRCTIGRLGPEDLALFITSGDNPSAILQKVSRSILEFCTPYLHCQSDRMGCWSLVRLSASYHPADFQWPWEEAAGSLPNLSGAQAHMVSKR